MDLWHLEGRDGDMPGWGIICLVTCVVSIMVDVAIDVAIYSDRPYQTYWVFTSLWLLIWGTMACCQLGKYIMRLHTKYRTEQPEQEKLKRKRKRKNKHHFVGGEHVVITPLYEGDTDYDYFEEGETE